MMNDSTSSVNLDDEVRHGRRSPYRFTMVPQWVLLMPDLSDAGYRVYSLLLAHVNTSQADGKAWPHQKTLADMLGRRREAVGRVIREELEPSGLVTVQEERYSSNSSRRRNVYFVHEEPPVDKDVYSSLSNWRERNGKNAGQPGGAENRTSGGAKNDSSGRAENRTSGGAENRASNYTNGELDQRGTTHTAADAESVSAEVVDRVCKKLADTIKGRGVKRPKITYAWRDAARDLLTPDEEGFAYTLEEIEGGIEWAQAHSFWASRVMTMKKFAEHFPKILSQARGELGDPKTEAGKKVHDDLVSRRLKRMDQMESELEENLGRPLTFSEKQKMREYVEQEIQ